MGNFIDHTGRRVGKWTVIRLGPRRGNVITWEVLCDCGTPKILAAQVVNKERSHSCGCDSVRRTSDAKTSHGHALRGRRTPTYLAWASMNARCANSTDPNYGGRGITVCDRWRESFAAFLEDMGQKPEAPPGRRRYWSIDRIDNDGNYEPGNCRWATKTEQNRNTRRTIRAEVNGVVVAVADLADAAQINPPTLRKRLAKLGDINKALNYEFRSDVVYPTGQAVHSAKLTLAAVEEIRSAVAAGQRQSPLAERFGVSRSTISAVVKRKKWR